MEITSAWAKVLLIYENNEIKSVGVFNGSKEFFTLERMSTEEIGELFGANPNNLKYDKGTE